MRLVGLAIGVVTLGAGAYFLVTGLQAVLDFPIGSCFGADCFDMSAAFVTLPAAIIALVVGGIISMVAVGSIRQRNPGALGGISGLSALGALFVLMAGAFFVVTGTTSSIVGGVFVLTAVIFGLTGLALMGVDQWLASRRRRARRLRAAGKRGSATILSVSDSNVTINNDPMVNLRLQVHIPNHPPYEVTKRQVISRIAVGQFVPGAVLPVLVDPEDPDDVMIDDGGDMAAPVAGFAAGGLAGAGQVVRLGNAGPAAGAETGSGGLDVTGATLSPDLMATISDALRRAADQFASGDPGTLNSTTITVNGQTFQIPGGAGQTVVIEPSGRIVTGPVGSGGTTVIDASGTAPSMPLSASTLGAPSTPSSPASSPSPVPVAPSAGATSATGPANGRVSIESLNDTGTQLGEMRLYSFELTVSPAGGQPYKVPHAALVPVAQIPRLIKGASFPAVIDPALPGGLGIFWDR